MTRKSARIGRWGSLVPLAAAASVIAILIGSSLLTNGAFSQRARPARVIVSLDPKSFGVKSVAFGPNGSTLATADSNGSVYLRAVTGQQIPITSTFQSRASLGVNSVAFSPDGRILAAGDCNGHVYLWHVTNGKLATILAGKSSQGVNSVAFSRDGQTLAAGDSNGHIYLWHITARKIPTTLLHGGSKGVNAVAFSPDGRTLAAGDYNGRVYLLRPTTEQLVTMAPGVVRDPNAVNIQAFITRYFLAINHHSYAQYRVLFAPSALRNSAEGFAAGVGSAHDSNIIIQELSRPHTGQIEVMIYFISHQPVADSATHTACTRWNIALYLGTRNHSYRIMNPPRNYHAKAASC